MTVVWNFPTRILFGEGAAALAGAEAARLGSTRALIVSDEGVVDAGLVEDVEKSLRRAKIPFEVFSDVSSSPLEREVVAGQQQYRRVGADIVIAMGGGSALDVGKLVRLLAVHPPPLQQYGVDGEGQGRVEGPLPPMIALPTTAGTGTEVSRGAVCTLGSTNRKTSFAAAQLMPDVAILDPALTTTMPASTTAATGFDALTHCTEAYCAKGDHPMVDAIALEGIALVGESLAQAVQDGENAHARGNMLKAAMMGGVALQKGLGACHSLAHPLSAECGLHHGLANALCLPAVLDFNRSAVPDRIARIARLLGVRGDDLGTLAFECAGAVRALRKKVGLPAGLNEAGVDPSVLPKLAQLAAEDAAHGVNPRDCAKDDLLALYKSSL